MSKSKGDRWTDAKTQSFISRYIALPSLWNVNDANYALKSSKYESYKTLMDEFDLTLTQARNKIRIYRTTYSQELKKMESNKEYVPKLSWFPLLHSSFHQGKVKSFVKTSKKTNKVETMKAEKIEIEFQDETDDGEEENETQYEIKKMGKVEDTSDHHHIIIEPYDDDYEEEENLPIQNVSTTSAITSENRMFGTTSNELFLKSIQSTLDKLPEEKNMRARIKIQEILYQIAYEK